jgi:8-oxo-dGTP pyrophosphatase MutT (NUDIX family)
MIANEVLAAIRTRLAVALDAPTARYMPLLIGDVTVGWLDDARAARLAAFADVFAVGRGAMRINDALATLETRNAALARVAETLAAEGQLTQWRNERYPLATHFGAPPLALIERAAARYFGLHTHAAHLNGLVHGEAGTAMWIARRSPTKAIDPGMLDNLVGGGIAAGMGVAATIVKESWEEAGIDAALAQHARCAGALHICRAQPDGLQRETIFVYDLALPASFVPRGEDGEVVEHRRVSLADAARLVANTRGDDVVTADASLVIVDCLLRHGSIEPDAPAFLALEGLRHPVTRPAKT